MKYPEDNPKWARAENVVWFGNARNRVNITFRGRVYRNQEIRWGGMQCKDQNYCAIENEMGWFNVWFYDSDIQE
jgi:hypothetical protein